MRHRRSLNCQRSQTCSFLRLRHRRSMQHSSRRPILLNTLASSVSRVGFDGTGEVFNGGSAGKNDEMLSS